MCIEDDDDMDVENVVAGGVSCAFADFSTKNNYSYYENALWRRVLFKFTFSAFISRFAVFAADSFLFKIKEFSQLFFTFYFFRSLSTIKH